MESKNFNRGKLIGRGGFSDVYMGTYNNFAVAIKIFRIPFDVEYSDFRENCFREASLLKSLSHENVIKFVDFFEQIENKEILFLMELVDGGSLKRFCKNIFLPIEEKKNISKLCWKGLAYLHENGVCHKDIKPENILVSSDFLSVKIGDFGLSELKKMATAYSTSVKGTCMYFPPEFASDDRVVRHPTYSDVYSTGATLCELFSGHHFWSTTEGECKNDAQIMYILINQNKAIQTNVQPVDPTCWKHIPIDVQIILANAVAPNYKKRKSASEIFILCDGITFEMFQPEMMKFTIDERPLPVSASIEHSMSSLQPVARNESQKNNTASKSPSRVNTNSSNTGKSRKSKPTVTTTMQDTPGGKRFKFVDCSEDVAEAVAAGNRQIKIPVGSVAPEKDIIPDGFMRMKDCSFLNCLYSGLQMHFHCTKPTCNYSCITVKHCYSHTIVAHGANHVMNSLVSSLDQIHNNLTKNSTGPTKVCSNVICEVKERMPVHYHCGKCQFWTSESIRLAAHTKQHTRLDQVASLVFHKVSQQDRQIKIPVGIHLAQEKNVTSDGILFTKSLAGYKITKVVEVVPFQGA